MRCLNQFHFLTVDSTDEYKISQIKIGEINGCYLRNHQRSCIIVIVKYI